MTAPGTASAVQLSVVIAAHNAAHVISTCLDALERQPDRRSMEIIVADSSTDGTDALIQRAHPDVRLLHVDEPLGVPQLRGRAIAVARGEIIAILDPFSVPDDRWSAEVLAAHAARPNLVIGGEVDLYEADTQPLLAWAIYLNEYGMFMPPTRTGIVSIVPGSNVSYKRACLYDDSRPRRTEFWKTFVNDEAAAGGSPLWLESRIRVALNKPTVFSDFLRTRPLHGRCFAAMRTAEAGWLTRLARAATTPAVPFVLWARWTRAFWPKRRRRGIFLATLPLHLLLFAAWAWGELLGYVAGPGDTCQRLYY